MERTRVFLFAFGLKKFGEYVFYLSLETIHDILVFRVSNATVSVANVEDAHSSTRLLAQTTLRNILGTKDLYEILSNRESISGSMQTVLDEATAGWGIKVERVEM